MTSVEFDARNGSRTHRSGALVRSLGRPIYTTANIVSSLNIKWAKCIPLQMLLVSTTAHRRIGRELVQL